MSDADDFFNQVPTGVVVDDDVPRDGMGRYLLPDPASGEVYGHTRVSTLAGSMDSGYALGAWRDACVAKGFAYRPDLLARAGSADPEDVNYKKLMKSIIDAAFEAGGGSHGSNMGTAQHVAFARHFFNGEPIENLPDFFHADLRAVKAKLEEKGVKILSQYVERVVRCHVYGRGGRIDAIGQLSDGTLAIVDLKTEKDPVTYPEGKTVQLSYYANSDGIMNYETGQYEPMPPVRQDFALVIWCRPGSGEAELYTVPIDLGWMGARVAEDFRAWKQQKIVIHPYIPGTNLAPPVISRPGRQEGVYAAAVQPAIQENGSPNGLAAHAKEVVNQAVNQAAQTGQPIDAAQVAQMNQQVQGFIPNSNPALAAVGLPKGPAVPPGVPVGQPLQGVPPERPPLPKNAVNKMPPAELFEELITRSMEGIDEVAFYLEMTQELAELSKQETLQPLLRLLEPGIDEKLLKRHRGPLAEMIVEKIQKQRAIRTGQAASAQPPSDSVHNTPAPQEVPTPQGLPTQPQNGFVDMTYEGVMKAIAECPSEDRLGTIYQQWITAYGPQNWVGQILDAANAKMNELRQLAPAGR